MSTGLSVTVFGETSLRGVAEIEEIASQVNYEVYDAEKIMDPLPHAPSVILCYPPLPAVGMGVLEIAQTLRGTYPEIPIFFIALDKADFDKKKLIKNGFTQAFLVPWEKADLIKAMREEAIYSKMPELRDYKPIKVVDLIPGTILDFNLKVFMPLNGKLVPFSFSGSPITEGKLQKLFESSLNTLYVAKEELPKFQQYTATVLKSVLGSTSMSETEKQEKLDKAVRDLISDMFIQDNRENTFGKSGELLKEVKEVINLLVKDGNENVLDKISGLVNQEKNFYLHLSNVSTYAGLFAMILGLEKPENVALAGLLHDIGKINLPQEIGDLEFEELNPDGREAYKNHPAFTIDVLKLKRIVLPDMTVKAILQHHEAMNGTGYPKQLDGNRISKEARVLAIANTFDHLTTIKEGKKSMTPYDAMNFLYDENSKDPGRMLLDIDMVRRLKEVLIK